MTRLFITKSDLHHQVVANKDYSDKRRLSVRVVCERYVRGVLTGKMCERCKDKNDDVHTRMLRPDVIKCIFNVVFL